jgi:hypothetical protein
MKHGKKIRYMVLIGLVAIFTLMLTACDALENLGKKQDDTFTKYTYADPNPNSEASFGSFSIEYPSGWGLTEVDGCMVVLKLGTNDEDRIEFIVHRDAGYYIDNVRENYSWNSTELTKDNRYAPIFIAQGTPHDRTYHVYDYGTDNGNNYYAIVNISRSLFEANRDKIDHVMQSFTLITANQDQQQDSTLTKHTYTDPMLGSFSVEYPSDWDLREQKCEPGSYLSTLVLTIGPAARIEFTIDSKGLYIEEVKKSFTLKGTERTKDNRYVPIYISQETQYDVVYHVYDYGKENHNYYYADVMIGRSLYDANRDKIDQVMQSFSLIK